MKYIFLLLFIHGLSVLNGQIITTAVGNGTAGYSGDGGSALSAQLKNPSSIAFDKFGNLYIADAGNHRIRKVTPAGIISTVAGTGNQGYNGDGLLAINADLNGPTGVVFDASGNLYIAEYNGYRVRRVDATGTITTFAGMGGQCYNGDGIPATTALLCSPFSLTTDASGNVFIADVINCRIRKVNSSGIISTFAGNGLNGLSGDGGLATSAKLNQANGIAFDTLGNAYVADGSNSRIRKINTSGIITTFAGTSAGFSGDGGPATSAQMFFPKGIAIDGSGNMYIADQYANRIRKIDYNGVITTFAGTGTGWYGGDGGLAINAMLYEPTGIAFDLFGNIYIADYANHRIRKIILPTRQEENRNSFQKTETYPNPTSDNFKIEISKEIYNGEIELTNVLGQSVLKQDVTQGKNLIKTENLAKGIYSYMVYSNKTVISVGKVVIE